MFYPAMLQRFVEDGMAVLLTTPYMDEAARCHRVGLIDRGRLLAEGAPDALVKAFPHTIRIAHLGAHDRRDAEGRIADRPEVLSSSPHGSDLRLVIRHDGVAAFEDFARSLGWSLESARADFEDVYLGLLATRAGGAN